MKLGILVCDHVRPEYRDIAGDYPDMFGRLLDMELVPYDVVDGSLPPREDACDAYLCTGSRYSSFDDLGWIHDLKAFIQRLSNAEIPFVGICFGHQVLAEALGGTVERAEGGWGAGVHTIDVLRKESWMQPPLAKFRLPYMHQDQVTRLPEGGVWLGRTEHCPIAIFRAGSSMLGIQAHPEFPAAYSEALIRDRYDKIGAEKAEEALISLEVPTDEEVVAGWIAEFLSPGRIPGT